MTRLRLGSIDEAKSTKVTLELPGELMRLLDDYAIVHARMTGLATPLAPERIIPAMIQRFIAGDREFSKQRRNLKNEN